MASDQTVDTSVRLRLNLPAETGERFPEEWKIVAHRVEVVHSTPVSHDTEPAGAPRLDIPCE